MTVSRTLARTGTEIARPHNRVTVLEFDGTRVTHEYDALYRLVTDQRDGSYAFNRTYTYDEVGNRLTKSDSGALCTYGYDQADQLLRVGPWGSYAYPTVWSSDENGNLTVENYVGNVTSYTFDTENRLTKVVQPSGYTEENQYSQDGLRRVRLAGTSTITYLWDDHVLLRDNSIFTTLPGAPGGLLASKGGTTHRFYIPDMQGHIRQVTDIDGDAIAEYQYDAWGLIQLTAASAMAFGDWGYTWDGKPGRYYVQQRHLRADLGRWMSTDPVETEPPYAYVGNRPTWAADPSGRTHLVFVHGSFSGPATWNEAFVSRVMACFGVPASERRAKVHFFRWSGAAHGSAIGAEAGPALADVLSGLRGEPVVVVCHSNGGNVAVGALNYGSEDARVNVLVRLGSPPMANLTSVRQGTIVVDVFDRNDAVAMRWARPVSGAGRADLPPTWMAIEVQAPGGRMPIVRHLNMHGVTVWNQVEQELRRRQIRVLGGIPITPLAPPVPMGRPAEPAHVRKRPPRRPPRARAGSPPQPPPAPIRDAWYMGTGGSPTPYMGPGTGIDPVSGRRY